MRTALTIFVVSLLAGAIAGFIVTLIGLAVMGL